MRSNRADGSGTYSSVDELVLPIDAKGHYSLKTGAAYGPDKALWSYTAPKKGDFYSSFISGAHRLANGNTFICSGANGTIFEVTPDKEIVWKYINPAKDGIAGKGGKGPGGKGPDGKGPFGKGPGGFGGPPQPGQILPAFMQDMLKLTEEQRKQLGDFQKEVTGKLDKILTEEQTKQLKNGKAGFGPGPQPGQLISPFLQTTLKLGDEQKKQIEELQKETDARLEKLLADEQRKQLKDMRAGAGGPGFMGAKGPGGPGGGMGPPGGASLFRAYRFAASYPGLAGRELTPGPTVEELQAKEEKSKQNKAK